MHFFIFVIVIPLKFIDFLENLKKYFSRTGLVVFALIDKDFLEFTFYAFNYFLGVMCWDYLIVFAIQKNDRDIEVDLRVEIYSKRIIFISNSLC